MKWSSALAMVLLIAGCGGDTGGASGEAVAGHPGEQTYHRFCFSCHAAGVAGAPRVGDADAWAPLIAKGSDLLLERTIAGVPPGMPARGLCTRCSDDELDEAIDYMIERSR
jgi:cytochrome c5